MWRAPLSLFGGSGEFTIEFLMDIYIGDLFTYLGSPSAPVEVVMTANAIDVAEIIINGNFAAGSTFEFIGINGGRFIGTGGAGGKGGNDNGADGTGGLDGVDGGHAIACSHPYTVDVDVDDGFLLGGGGGGGGGSFNDLGAAGTPGGGGGGGQGWGDALGGEAGNPTGSPVAAAGQDGTQTTFGAGGAGGTSGTNDGGAASVYGFAGQFGMMTNPTLTFQATRGPGQGGAAGNAGSAFYASNSCVMTLSGVKTETVLRSENRMQGETTGRMAIFSQAVDHFILGSGTEAIGYTFKIDGTIERDSAGGTSLVDWFEGTSLVPEDYEMRTIAGTGNDNWDFEGSIEDPVSPGWVQFVVLGPVTEENWSIAATDGFQKTNHVFEIRRTDEDFACATAELRAAIEFEP
jgi:hypothetical protein